MKMYDFVEKANKNQHKHMRMVVFSSYRHVIVYWRVSETQPKFNVGLPGVPVR